MIAIRDYIPETQWYSVDLGDGVCTVQKTSFLNQDHCLYVLAVDCGGRASVVAWRCADKDENLRWRGMSHHVKKLVQELVKEASDKETGKGLASMRVSDYVGHNPSVDCSDEDWEVREQGDADAYFVATHEGRWIGSFRMNGEETPAKQKALVKIIAAAPRMLKACEAMVKAEDMQKGLRGGYIMGVISIAIDLAKTAMAKIKEN
jgi:hypothetical protein